MVSLAQGVSSYTNFGDGTDDDWLYISPNLGFKDEAAQGETDINQIITNIKDVIEKVVDYGSAFANGTDNIQNAISCLETAKNVLARMGEYNIAQNMTKYNDNKEKAMSEHYREILQDYCRQWDAYADGNINYCTRWYSPSRGRITIGWWSGGYFQRGTLQDSDRVLTDTGIGTVYGEPKEYDQIGCDRFIKSFDSFLDMRNSRMVAELEKRKYELNFELIDFERPADTGGGGTTVNSAGYSHSSGKF